MKIITIISIIAIIISITTIVINIIDLNKQKSINRANQLFDEYENKNIGYGYDSIYTNYTYTNYTYTNYTYTNYTTAIGANAISSLSDKNIIIKTHKQGEI